MPKKIKLKAKDYKQAKCIMEDALAKFDDMVDEMIQDYVGENYPNELWEDKFNEIIDEVYIQLKKQLGGKK